MSRTKDELGDRMKRYERSWSGVLPPNSWVLVRVDGRAFHTWTRGCERPFDSNVQEAMVLATEAVSRDIGGFRLAYTQSDEATFLFTDTAEHESQLWFGGEVAKIVSITAAGFTAHFNRAYETLVPSPRRGPAVFDARVFTMPPDDAPNAFVWRQRDWQRNSVQMLARHHFSQRDLNGQNVPAMLEMLSANGINWHDLGPRWRNGTFVFPSTGTIGLNCDAHDWASIAAMAGIEG